MSLVRLDPRSMGAATLRPPSSKSDAQRALVLASVLGLEAPEGARDDDDAPADVRAAARGLEAIERSTRAGESVEPGASGASGAASAASAASAATAGAAVDVDCGDGGAPLRLLLAQAAVTPGSWVSLRGSARLGERPHGALIAALAATLGEAGLTIDVGSPWPIAIQGATGRAVRPAFTVDASQSSQHASALVLAAAALAAREGRAWSVTVEGEVASAGYLAMTLRWVEAAGFEVEQGTPGTTTVRLARRVDALPEVAGDWSSIGYLLPMTSVTGGWVDDVDRAAGHPDEAIVGVATAGGWAFEARGRQGALRGRPARGLRASGAACPDLLPTVAAMACVAPSASVLEGVAVLRRKESDRVEGIEQLVAAAGGRVRHEGDALIVEPPARVARVLRLDAAGDHRRAMAAATLAVLAGVPLDLTGAEHVAKSFPGFWRQLAAAGARCERVET